LQVRPDGWLAFLQILAMLPGSFVERKRSCGQPNCRCADGKNLHSQIQIAVLADGKPKTLNIPIRLAEQVREKIEMRRCFESAAATICRLNLKRFLKEKETAGGCPGAA
jgi:hypothetical protein